MPLIERDTARRRPQHNTIDAILRRPLERRLEQPFSGAAARRRPDEQVRHIGVAIALADGIRHFLDDPHPNLADDRSVLIGDPRPPGTRLELAAHPHTAAIDERALRLDRWIAAGAEFPAQGCQRPRVSRRSRTDDHTRRWARNCDAAVMAPAAHSCPPSN